MTDPMETPVTKREMEATFDAFLAVLMERLDKRFEQVDKRFEQVDKRFEQVDKRFEQIDKRFEQIDNRFEQVDKRYEQVDKRFADLDKSLDERFAEAHRNMLSTVRGSADEVRNEIRALDRANETRHREDLVILDEKYETLPARVKKLEAAVFKPAPLKRRRSR